jgi:hypothetical protein
MGVGLRALWWTPGQFSTSLLADRVDPMSADLSARQYVRHHADNPSNFRVASVPPRTTASWLIPQVDWQLGYWSVDDVRIAGTGEVTDGTDEVQAYVVRRASDGAALLTVSVSGVPLDHLGERHHGPDQHAGRWQLPAYPQVGRHHDGCEGGRGRREPRYGERRRHA